MLRLARDLGAALRDKTDAARRSSSARRWCPARSRTCCGPILERESGKKDGVDFHVCFQPEFLREGSSIRDYDKPPFTIVGANARRRRSEALRRAVRPPAVRVPRDLDPRRRDGEVLLQQLPRAQDHLRQRDGAAVRGARRRPVRGHGPGVPGHAAQHLAAPT